MRAFAILCLLCLQKCIESFNTTGYCSGILCIPNNYDRLVRPLQNETINIQLDFDILQILSVNDYDFTITLSMYFGIRWDEPRIICPQCQTNYTPVDLSFMKILWVPDVYIYNLESISTSSIISDFAGMVLRISKVE